MNSGSFLKIQMIYEFIIVIIGPSIRGNLLDNYYILKYRDFLSKF